jgi:hypothetical protein
MSRINEQVLQPLVSATTSAIYKYRKRKGHDILTYSLYSDAVNGTYKLETATPGGSIWIDVPSGSFTAETSGTFVPGQNMDIRWNCTAYTSGSTVVRIG